MFQTIRSTREIDSSETKHRNASFSCNLILITTVFGRYSGYLSFTDEETEAYMG